MTKMKITYYATPAYPAALQDQDGDWILVGLADMGSTYMMPVWKDRRPCKREARSKYIPHQGRQECARRVQHNAKQNT